MSEDLIKRMRNDDDLSARTEAADLIERLTSRPGEDAVERVDALAKALCLLDTFAGEGLAHIYGNGQELDASDVCVELAGAFGMECEPGWWRTLALAALSHDPQKEALVEIADDLVDQRSEPWPGTDADRLHYWRNKAIYAARRLQALSSVEGIVKGLSERVRGAVLALSDEWQGGPYLSDDVLDRLATLQAAGLVERQFADMGPPRTTSNAHGLTTKLSACWHFRLTPLGIACRNRILSEQE